MKKDLTKFSVMTGRRIWVQRIIDLIPKSFRLMFNPNRYCIEKFIKESSSKLKQGSRVLDAGAGRCAYKHFFNRFSYEATDFVNEFNNLDFVCSLDKIPKKNDTYDSIICTEVLEHVEYPQKVINELYRVLKKGGKLFMTVPQEWKIHQEPYNFYYFTKYGLKSLFENAGFKKYKIHPKGGYFWFLADTLRFNGLLEQYKKYWFLYYPLKILEYPINNIILPFFLFHLDFLDKKQDWTIGYLVEAEK